MLSGYHFTYSEAKINRYTNWKHFRSVGFTEKFNLVFHSSVEII